MLPVRLRAIHLFNKTDGEMCDVRLICIPLSLPYTLGNVSGSSQKGNLYLMLSFKSLNGI